MLACSASSLSTGCSGSSWKSFSTLACASHSLSVLVQRPPLSCPRNNIGGKQAHLVLIHFPFLFFQHCQLCFETGKVCLHISHSFLSCSLGTQPLPCMSACLIIVSSSPIFEILLKLIVLKVCHSTCRSGYDSDLWSGSLVCGISTVAPGKCHGEAASGIKVSQAPCAQPTAERYLELCPCGNLCYGVIAR